ncbi:hydroxylysine kinase-like isoform X2 [Takifugu rubripes]|nr:hydroxylysine kinase-like isoform X2 [Takifugu rubripes]XP_029684318.1 hydroxylysine kinase-like isoform X2 [Takifugu rubripes]XP_056895096.1 hydroxylysine kinase-like isoform X2 [Takifugu flavidus]XP_056895097.1 hydroxylysine kinase-like isoform X2 [Takifugu flavidus]XP_056895098.1 hydroxylysine kinase-like isoform X2 [Takifugu flavidus]|eukprot:XP_011612893.1 PREDICTED: hydroxylysine kinase-like [Takifugu rubripes]
MSEKRSNPNFSKSQAAEITKRLFGLTPSEMDPLPSYYDQNFYVTTAGGAKYVLKIFNFKDSENPTLIGVQVQCMSFLYQNGLPVPTAVPTTSGQLMSLEEADFGCGYQKYLVILLTFLPGTTISKVPSTPQLLYEVGRTAARMDKTLQNFQHPHYDELQRDQFIWSLSNIPLLEGYLHVLDGDPLKEVVEALINQYKTSVIPKRSSFCSSLIHADLNDLNILVQPDENGDHLISGIVDFSDMQFGYYIYELAITIMYMMMEHPNPIEVGGPVLAGWESVLPLNEAEKDCLYTLVISRFCQSCVLARYLVLLHPENAEYVISTSEKGIPLLHQLWERGKEEVEKVWFEGASQYNHEKKEFKVLTSI